MSQILEKTTFDVVLLKKNCCDIRQRKSTVLEKNIKMFGR